MPAARCCAIGALAPWPTLSGQCAQSPDARARQKDASDWSSNNPNGGARVRGRHAPPLLPGDTTPVVELLDRCMELLTTSEHRNALGAIARSSRRDA
jgi:hypothetical protein